MVVQNVRNNIIIYFTSSEPRTDTHLSWYNLLTFYSGILPGILFDIIFWHSIWNLFWHSFLAFYLAYLGGFFVVEVRRGTLWSGARGWSPAGNTLIRSLRWRPGGEHSDPELAVEVWRGTLLLGSGGEHCDLELAVEVRRGAEEGGRKDEGGRKEEQPSPDRWGGNI